MLEDADATGSSCIVNIPDWRSRLQIHGYPSVMFCLGNGEQLGGSQPIKDQLDLTVPKKYAFPLILHFTQDFASLGKKSLNNWRGFKSLFETGGKYF